MDELLSIGDFSARCGLSAKMLRSYAGSGLLVPAAVDDSSGYRYYSTGQLHQARVIVLLRRAGIAIDDIVEFFESPDSVQLDRWDRRIVRDSTARRQALVRARAALAMGQARPPTQPETSKKGSEVTHSFVTGTATHIGGRDTNEDAVLVSDGLFAVADGIGGLQDGEVASRLALDTLDVAFAADRTVSGLLDACQEANGAVWQQADGQDNIMGTTLAAFAVTSDAAGIVLHAGDSRLYRLRNGRLEQVTHDHTVIADLLRAREITEEGAAPTPTDTSSRERLAYSQMSTSTTLEYLARQAIDCCSAATVYSKPCPLTNSKPCWHRKLNPNGPPTNSSQMQWSEEQKTMSQP